MGCTGNCSCKGKTCESQFTGDIIFDGNAFDCADDSLDIASGEKLNSILEKMFPVLCLANEKPVIIREEGLSINLTGAQLDIGNSINLANAGDYHVRAVVSYFMRHNAVLPINVSGPIRLKLDAADVLSDVLTFTGNDAEDSIRGTLVIEGEITGITLPQVLQIHTPGLTATDGDIIVEGYTLVAKRIR